MSSDAFGLRAWVEKLCEEQLPIFGQTALSVAKLCEKPKVPTSLLANVILQDASMTARLVRLANSAFYTKGRQVTTVSGAIMLLGLDVVRGTCMTIGIVDSVLRGKPREQLLRELARSFYAATIARMLARYRRDESPEAVFVAALLFRLGQMAFWSFGGSTAQKLEAVLQDPNVDPAGAEQTLVGCRLSALTLELVRIWNLGALLEEALTWEGNEQHRAFAIVLGQRMAGAVQDDRESVEIHRLLKQMSTYAQAPVEEIEELVADASELSGDLARKFGAAVTVARIPGQTSAEELESAETSPPEKPERDPAQGDPILQLKVLRELVVLGEGGSEPDTLIELALEGVYRGVGLDRVCFLVLSGDGTMLRPKYILGADADLMFQHFHLKLERSAPNLFFEAVHNDQSIWAPFLPEAERRLLTPEVLAIVRNGPFLITPVRFKGKVSGLFYGDRLPSGRPIDSEASESFELFVFQVNQLLQR